MLISNSCSAANFSLSTAIKETNTDFCFGGGEEGWRFVPGCTDS
jgi:hypothetical protein